MKTQVNDEFYAQLLPIEGDRVLLPAAAIREALQLDRIELNSGSPAWLLGFARSMGERLPVVSIEGMMGKAIPARNSRARMVRVVSTLGKGDWMLVTQGQPHLTPLNMQALRPAPLASQDSLELILARGKIANLIAFIPDLEEIEKRIGQALLSAQASEADDWSPDSITDSSTA